MLLLQEFEIEIQHRPDMVQHAIADYLSRIENDENAIEGDDDFPDNRILRFSASGVETDKS